MKYKVTNSTEILDTKTNKVVAIHRDPHRTEMVQSISEWIEKTEEKFNKKEYDKVTYPKDWHKHPGRSSW